MTVFNFGTGPATIGNIVVNLQKRVGKNWITVSSDVADATNGDDATTANIHAAASSENKSTFSENAASGSLEFMDATNNTIFSLVPQVTVPAGGSLTLLFSAAFDKSGATTDNKDVCGVCTPAFNDVLTFDGSHTSRGQVFLLTIRRQA